MEKNIKEENLKEQKTENTKKKKEVSKTEELKNKVNEPKKEEIKRKDEKNSNNKNDTKSKVENKLKDSPKAKVKKEKKSKKWLLVVVLLIILIILALMVLYTSITPRSSVNNLFTNLKNGNKFMANLNINYDELISVLDTSIVSAKGSSMSDLEKECFNELSWEITGESVENQTATVTATITTKNFRQVLLNWIEKISEVLENQDDISTEQNLQLLNESLVQDNVDTRTNEVTISLERKGLTWKVNINDEFIDAIYPGLNQVLDVMEQLSNELEEDTAQ